MAIVSSLIGGLTGFISFLMAFILFDVSFLASLAIYSGTGIAVTILIMAGALLFSAISGRSGLSDPEAVETDAVAGSPAQQ